MMNNLLKPRTWLCATSSRLAAFLLAATAFGGGLSAFATTYTWTGGGNANQDGSYNWNDTENWSVPTSDTDNTPMEPPAAPTASDTTIIDTGSAVTITCASGDYFGTLTVNRAVTFTGQAAVTKSVSGSGTITFDAFTFRKSSSDSGDPTVSNDVVVNNNVIMANHYNGESNVITFSGNVSGSGNLLVETNNKNNGCGFRLTGTANTFAGRFRGCNTNNGIRDGSRIANSDCSSEDAVYELGYTSNDGGCVLQTTDGTVEGAKTDYKFGALSGLNSGFSLAGTKNLTLTIGNRNDVTSTLSIKSSWSGTANTINKVGSGEMQLAASVATLNVNAGTVTLTDSSNVPVAIAIADGTTLGFADDAEFATSFITPAGAATIDVAAGKSVTLADAFAALTKTGAGVLTLTTVPTGSITVSAGYVYLPANAEPTLDTDTTGSVETTDGLMLYNKNDVNVWTGAANDNTWATGENWSKGAAPSAATDVVIIPEGADTTITCAGSSDRTGVLTILRNVTLTGAGMGITVDTISGTGTLSIHPGQSKIFYFTGGTGYTINCGLCVDNNNFLNCGSSVLTLNGALTGSGTITQGGGVTQPGIWFRGDTSAFAGSYTGGTRGTSGGVPNNSERDGTQFLGNARGSALASWTFGRDDTSNDRSPFRAGDDVTYEFGRLNSTRYSQGDNAFTTLYKVASSGDRYINGVTFKIGALAGTTSNVGGTLYNGTTGDTTAPNKIVKVGDTSTLNLRLTASEGALEVEAGTVNLVYLSSTTTTDEETQEETTTYTAYAPVAMTITGTNGVLVADSAVAALEGFAPVLSEELAETYVLGSTTDETTGAVTYQLANVCTVGGVGYTSLDNAKAALTEENDTIVLTAATPSKLTLLPGETVKLDNPQSLSWGGIAWPANGYVESVTTEGTVTTYAALDNTAATWTNGSGDNKWSTAANWSTGYVPDSGTVVTLPNGATIYTGTVDKGGYCGGMVVEGAATISYDASMGNYTAIVCCGDITGENGVLTLARAGINANNGAITIGCALEIENDTAAYTTSGYDSYLQAGTFTINGDVTVNGLLRTYAAATFNGKVTVADGGTITSYSGSAPTFNGAVTLTGKSGIYTYAVTYNGAVTLGDDAVISVGSSTQNYGSGFVLNGSGTWIGDTQTPANTLQTNLRNNNGNNWTGTCELYNLSVTTLTPSSFANNNSTVRLKKVSAGNIAAGTYACGIELAGDGLTISGDYSRNITFSGKFSGSGALKVGTVGSSGFNLYITGDYSGFTGGVQFTNSSTRNRRVVFGASSTSSTGSCVVIAQGASLTVDSGAVWGPTNLVVLGEITFNGTLNIPAGGIWGSGNTGNRTIRFNDLSKAPNCAMFAGSWNGTCVLGDPAADGTEIKLYNFGNANSTIELAGVTAGYIGINGNTNVTSKVVLSGNVKLTNGWPTTVQAEGSMPTTRLTTLASVGGTGDLELNYTGTSSSWSSSSKGHIVVNKLDGAYTGDITIGNFWLLEVDAVDFAAAPTTAGSALIGLTVAENGTLYNAAHNAVTTSNGKAIDVTVAGAASTEKLVLGSDGLYLAVASVDGTYYATLQDAVDAAGANTVTLLADGQSAVLAGGSSVKIAKGVYSCTITAGEGYTLSDATEEGVTTYTTTLQYAAKIGSTYYDTVDAAWPSLESNRDAVVEVLDSTYTVGDIFAQQLLAAGIIWDSNARTFAWAVVKDGNNLYASVAAAITGGATTITLNKNVTENVVLPAGVSFSAGSYTLTGTVTAASGSLLGVKNGVYTAYASNTEEEWVGGVSGNEWTVADNWSLGFVPVATTPVTFTTGEHSVVVTGWGTAKCASMTVNGTLTLTQTLGETGNCYCLDINGNVSGEGKIVLSHAGIWNATSNSITISVPIEVVATSDSTEVSRIGGVLNNGSDVGAIVLTGNLSVYFGARLQYEIDVQLNGGTLEVDGYMINKSGGYAKWLKVNGGTVNLNEGGELSICRFTAVGAMAINFNGGTLTEYGSGGDFGKIIGGQTDSWGDQGTITLTVKEKGLTVNTDANTTILPVLAGDGESTGGGLTKTGSGTLTLSATPTFTGAITVEGGSVVVPLAADVTLGGETYVSVEDGTTKTLSKHPGYAADSDGTAGDETVAVPLSWVKSNVAGFAGMTEEQIVTALAANSATLQANGYNYFTCYALGLDPADADDKPLVSVSVDANGNFVVTLTDKDGTALTTASNVTVIPSFYKYNPSTRTYSASPVSSTIAPADVVGEDNVGYIRAKIDVSAE